MNYEGNEYLLSLEENAPGYNTFPVKTFLRTIAKIPELDTQVLDFGAGIGTLAVLLRDRHGVNVECLETDKNQAKLIRLRGLKCVLDIQELPRKFSFVFMSNVLEHIEDDVNTLRQLQGKVLKSEGYLAIYVPAFQHLFSEIDRKYGHFRRYGKRELENKVKDAGFTVMESRYVDSVGYVSLYILRYLFRSKPAIQEAAPIIKMYDRVIFPLSRILDSLGLKKCFGKNILLIARSEVVKN